MTIEEIQKEMSNKRDVQLRKIWKNETVDLVDPIQPPWRFKNAIWDELDASVQTACLPFIERKALKCLLDGPTQAGKTFAAWCVTYGYLYKHGVEKAKYIDFPDLYNLLFQASGFVNQGQAEAQRQIDELKRAKFLFIDEFCLSKISNETVFMALFAFVNHRHNCDVSTLMTTSKTPETLLAEFPATFINSRVYEGLNITLNRRKAVKVKVGP